MGRTRHTAEQTIAKLREAGIALAKGQKTADVIRKLWITEQTYYRGSSKCDARDRPGFCYGYGSGAPCPGSFEQVTGFVESTPV